MGRLVRESVPEINALTLPANLTSGSNPSKESTYNLIDNIAELCYKLT
jgi:hypothetical protein